MLDAAAKEFREALKLDPRLENEPDTVALAEKLRKQ